MSDSESSISKSRSYEEMGEYWDHHDAGEVWDRLAPVEFEISIDSERPAPAVDFPPVPG
jgi:hypothetical protein